jgi:hypothetical protein
MLGENILYLCLIMTYHTVNLIMIIAHSKPASFIQFAKVFWHRENAVKHDTGPNIKISFTLPAGQAKFIELRKCTCQCKSWGGEFGQGVGWPV